MNYSKLKPQRTTQPEIEQPYYIDLKPRRRDRFLEAAEMN
jgi:hypothetical protein